MNDDYEDEYEEYSNLESNESPIPERHSNYSYSKRKSNVPNALNKRNMGKPNETSGNSAKKSRPGVKPKANNAPLGNNNVINRLKNKKNSLLPNPFTNKAKTDNQNSLSDTTDNNDEDDNSSDSVKTLDTIRAKFLKYKIIIIGALVMMALTVIVVIIAAIFSSFSWIFNIGNIFNSSKTNDSSGLVSNEENQKYAEEFLQELNSVIDKYNSSCNITIDKNYVLAVLSYKYTSSTLTSSSEKNALINMKNNVSNVVKLMVVNCSVDYSRNGVFYNNLKNSSFLKSYYADELKLQSSDQLVEAIFDYAEDGVSIANFMYGGYISDKLKVTMGTCIQPYNNKLLNEGTSYPSTVGFSEYVAGVIYGEKGRGVKKESIEFVKAFTIVVSSYALSRAQYKEGMDEIWVHSGNCWQVYCSTVYGCHYTYMDPSDMNIKYQYGTGYSGIDNKFPSNHAVMSDETRAVIDEAFKEVLGIVMMNNTTGKIQRGSHRDKIEPGLNIFSQDGAYYDALSGMNYKQILYKYYNDISLVNMMEGDYTSGVEYKTGGYNGDSTTNSNTNTVTNNGYVGSVKFYDQTSYLNSFCGKSSTIKQAGCGVTAMAMIVSTMYDSSYTPLNASDDAKGFGSCGPGISGTSASFFGRAAKKYGLGYQEVGKKGNLQAVTNALKSGKSLIIAHMGPGDFTRSGHYIVLSKVNSKGQVYVLDPNNGRGNGWHDFNKIVQQLRGSFHIITKR